MRPSTRVVPFFPVLLLALTLFCAIPAYASGDDKPAAASPTPAPTRPDREKKVITNDDIDLRWPKAQHTPNASQSPAMNTPALTQVQNSAPAAHTPRATDVRLTPDTDPARYAAQLEALSAEMDRLSSRERSLREFQATGTGTNLHFGLQVNAPCEGFTTENAIQQLAIQRQEIAWQIENLEAAAQQNGVTSGAIQHALEIQQAQKQLSPRQQQAALQDRQRQLIGELDGVRNELSGMSNEAEAQGMVLLPANPNNGGNMTTNLIQNLNSRADQIRGALDDNEDATRRAGLPPSTLR